MSSVINFKMILITIILSGFSVLSRGEDVSRDNVILENNLLKVTINRGRGGTISSVIYKPSDRELTEEFNSGEVWAGGLAEDRIAGQSYPTGEINTAQFIGDIFRGNGYTSLKLVYTSKTTANHGLKYIKIYKLQDNSTQIQVKLILENVKQQPITITPWIHNIVHRNFGTIVTPTPEGIKTTTSGPDVFLQPHRNWIGALDRKSGLFLYFVNDISELAKYYYGFWSGGFVGVEWIYKPVTIFPQKSWSTEYYICLVGPVSNVTYATPLLVGGYKWKDEGVNIELGSPVLSGEVYVSLTGHKNYHEQIKLHPAKTTVFFLSQKYITDPKVELELFNDKNQKIEPAIFKTPEANVTFYLAKGKTVSNMALPVWDGVVVGYKKIIPEKYFAQKLDSAGGISIWQACASDKVFSQSPLDKLSAKFPITAAARNEHETIQLILRNDTNNEQDVTVKVGHFILSDAMKHFDFAPQNAGHVTSIETKTPTGMRGDLPVGFYPDPIIPGSGFRISPGTNVAFRIITVPPDDAPAGIYVADVEFNVNQTLIKTQLKLEVFDFSLPVRSFLKTDFGCWPVSPKLLKEVGFEGTTEKFSMLCRQLYLTSRITPREKQISWSDIGKMKVEINDYLKSGMTTLNIPHRLVDQPQRLKQIADILEEMGILNLAFIYRYDEATRETWPKIINYSKRLKQINPKLKMLATVYANAPRDLYGFIDIWVRPVSSQAWIKERMKHGDEFWMVNFPESDVSLEGRCHDLRKVFWRLKFSGFTGALYWNCIAGYGGDNPWNDIYCSGANGQGHLIYPWKTGPITTLRWEVIRDGIEDYDYLCILQNLVSRARLAGMTDSQIAEATSVLQAAAKISQNETKDFNELNKVRLSAARCIVALKCKLKTEVRNITK